MLPFEPLINCDWPPKKNVGVATVTCEPLISVSPFAWIFMLPELPLIKLPADSSPKKNLDVLTSKVEL